MSSPTSYVRDLERNNWFVIIGAIIAAIRASVSQETFSLICKVVGYSVIGIFALVIIYGLAHPHF
jgi:hypothetical protein